MVIDLDAPKISLWKKKKKSRYKQDKLDKLVGLILHLGRW